MKLAMWIVRSPLDDSVEEGEPATSRGMNRTRGGHVDRPLDDLGKPVGW
jgi:hypothetical protein